MHPTSDAILEKIVSLIGRVVGSAPGCGPDSLIGRHFQVEGWDGIELLEELEAAYDVDLEPFLDARAKTQRFLFWNVKTGGDATPRELAEHIAALLRAR